MDVPPINTDCPNCIKLLKIVQQQAEQIKKLNDRIEKLERSGKRQAAPFRKARKPDPPKKPGRRSGDQHGDHSRRSIPEKIDETYDVPLPKCCPECDSQKVKQTATVIQYQTEIPRTPIYRQFNIAVGECECCNARVQGRHELQTSDATGACSSQLGPNLQAAIALLNKELGLSHGKVRRALQMLYDIKIARSTSCRSMLRTACRLKKAYEGIVRSVRGSPQVVPDETGWRVAGNSSWLHVFVGSKATCYRIDKTRSSQVAIAVLGKHFKGVLTHDGWSPYDSFLEAIHQQCNAHILRRLNSLIESATGALVALPQRLKEILLSGLETRDRFLRGEIGAQGCRIRAGQLLSRLVDIFLWEETDDPAQQRVLRFLDNHAESLFTYLKHPGQVDATNWRAEQAVRPAVVNRKVWGGNRTEVGAIAQSIIMSVFQTCHQRGCDPFFFLRDQIVSPTPLPLNALRR